jgi:hypothetical protein
MNDYTATELAELAGVSPQAVRYMCAAIWSKTIPPQARKSGSVWLIDRLAGDKYIRQKKSLVFAGAQTTRGSYGRAREILERQQIGAGG